MLSNHSDNNIDFSFLPKDLIVDLMAYYLDNLMDIICLAQATPKYYGLFQHQEYRLMILFRYLQTHAVLGKWEAVKKIGSDYPHLLDRKGSIKHKNRCYEYKHCNVKQMALMNGAFTVFHELNALSGIPLSHEDNQNQFAEKFPTGKIEIAYECDIQTVKNHLQAVSDAISLDRNINIANLNNMNADTQNALNSLYDYLNPEKYNTSQQGLVFDPRIYLQTLICYEENVGQFQNKHQRLFWCVKVKEAIATRLPTDFLQLHCQGIGNIIDDSEALNNDGCLLYDGTSYFSYQDSDYCPGVNFHVGYYGVGSIVEDEGSEDAIHFLQDYIEQNREMGLALSDQILGRKLLQHSQ